jgi:hypothetical protein
MSLEPHESRYTRSGSGALVVHEGLPEKWHYTIVLDDSRPELTASVTVMFDGASRCSMRLTQLGHNEQEAVKASRIRVLEWIGEYLHRHNIP